VDNKEIFMNTQQIISANSELLQLTQQSVAGTKVIDEGFVSGKSPRFEASEVSFEECSTLTAARKFCEAGLRTAILDFANPLEPGGGVLRGAEAQEESICRVSNLYNCLASRNAAPYYEYHNKMRTANGDADMFIGTGRTIYSPGVVVLDDNPEALLDTVPGWNQVDVITCAAPLFASRDSILPLGDLEHIFRARIRNILEAAIESETEALVLGAFGCGAFMNPPQVVAKVFRGLFLEERYRHAFRRVVFAVITNYGNIDLSTEKTVPTWILLQQWTVDVFRKAFSFFPLLGDANGTANLTASLQL
jgi:TIGR02452 family protein